MRTAKIIAVLFAATAVLGVSACGSDEPNDFNVQEQRPEPTTSQDKYEEDAETKARSAEELAKDIEIVQCAGGATMGVNATVEVTNSLEEPMEYIGTIIFRDAAGVQVTDGAFNTGTLEPGETSTEAVPGPNVYEKVDGVTCELTDVKIDEPV